MAEPPVLVERRGGLARWMLNRPDRRNALDAGLLDRLLDLFAAADRDDEARAIVLAGAGKGFCAGADLEADGMAAGTAAGIADEAAVVRHAERMSRLLAAPRLCAKPVVAEVHGFALGAGLGLAFACDAIVCEEDAHLAFPEVRHGLVPALVAPAVLRKAGYALAFRHLATGHPLPPRRAADLGLVDLAPSGGATERAAALAAGLAAAAPGLLPALKALLRDVDEAGADAAMALARRANVAAKLRRPGRGAEGRG